MASPRRGRATARGFMRRVRGRPARAPAGAGGASREADDPPDWPQLTGRLRVVVTVVRHRWDLPILANLDGERGTRPGDLVGAVNSQAEWWAQMLGEAGPQAGQVQLSPQVLSLRLRALERAGYVRHAEITRIPRVRLYFLLPKGRAALHSLRGLAPWDERMPDRRSGASAGRR
jgi:DNA-binding HxlR family transcriptional regulator